MGELSSAFEKADTNAAFPYSKRISFARWEFVSQLPTGIDGGQAEFFTFTSSEQIACFIKC